jgi:hypothetical protein
LLISLQQKLNAEKELELQIGKEGAEEAKQKRKHWLTKLENQRTQSTGRVKRYQNNKK